MAGARVPGGQGAGGWWRSCGWDQEGADDLAAPDGVPVPAAEAADECQAASGLGAVVGVAFVGDAGCLVVDGDQEACPVAEHGLLHDREPAADVDGPSAAVVALPDDVGHQL